MPVDEVSGDEMPDDDEVLGNAAVWPDGSMAVGRSGFEIDPVADDPRGWVAELEAGRDAK